jgi:hypothetical protein
MQLADGTDTPRAASLLARVSLILRGKFKRSQRARLTDSSPSLAVAPVRARPIPLGKYFSSGTVIPFLRRCSFVARQKNAKTASASRSCGLAASLAHQNFADALQHTGAAPG